MTITGGSTLNNNDGVGIRSDGILTLTAVHVTGNTATNNGGGIFNSGSAGSLTVINSTISNNTANNNGTTAGGGISDYSDGTTLTIMNSTISGNRVPNGNGNDGGGVLVFTNGALITNSTITDNEVAAGSSAGGVFALARRSTVTVRNSIIAGNCTRATNALCSNTTTPDVGSRNGAFVSQGYNLIGSVGGATVFNQTGDQTGNATAPLDPRLLPLADNGGTTPTHRLRGSSPALDKSDCGGCSSDQRGFSRPVDLPSIANVADASDIGSFELQLAESVDSTPPVITPLVTGTPGNNGWYTSNVQVSWSVVDDETIISNQTGCATQTVTTDTSGVTFTCSATSSGGTSSQSVTVKRDATAPSITFFSRTTPNANGWNNTNVAVQWNCADSLSGGVSPTVSNIVSAEGANLSTTGICTDNAGNTASNTQTGIKIDKTAPVIAFANRTAPNAAGWNNTNVTVNWNCADSLSGASSPSVNQTISAEGANLSAAGTCSDLAGNSASNTQSGIKIDKTAPVIAFASRTAPNAAGWKNTNVTVNWNCSDALSGALNSSVSQTVSTESANLSSTGTCFDVAGNSASNTQGGIKIDKTAPTLAPTVSPNPLILNSSASGSPNAADAISGIASASCAPVVASSVGFKTLVCTATDAAGNTASADANYQVIYNFGGFFSPISNLPATNTVAAGQIVDLTFSLAGDQGLNVIAAGYPVSTPIPCSSNAPGSASEPTVGFGRSAFTYSTFTNLYRYQWVTQASWAGTCRMFVLRLNDGTEHYAKFQFQ